MSVNPLRQTILEGGQPKFEEIELPGLPYTDDDGKPSCKYMIGVMSFEDRDSWEAECTDTSNPEAPKPSYDNVRAKLVVRTLCDMKQQRIFTNEDAPLVGKLDSSVLQPAFAKARKVNRLNKEDFAELTKN